MLVELKKVDVVGVMHLLFTETKTQYYEIEKTLEKLIILVYVEGNQIILLTSPKLKPR